MSIVFLGLLCILFIVGLRRPLTNQFDSNHKWVRILRRQPWFNHPWKAGLLLFALNAAVFGISALLWITLMYIEIPYIHLIVMMIVTVSSIWVWTLIHKAWEGKRIDRWKMAFTGSSFYLIMTLVFLYGLLSTPDASWDNSDPIMAFIGYLIAMFATAVAFVLCLFMTGYSRSHSS